jgi:GNAT superfamily N-acetyltransferase
MSTTGTQPDPLAAPLTSTEVAVGEPHPRTVADGLVIREVRAGDDDAIERLLGGLDADSRYRRWFTGGVDIREAERWATHPDQVGAVGLLAFVGAQPVGHAVLVPCTARRAEVAFEVAAPWRRHGIAGALLERLLELAAEHGLREIYADVLPENADMLAVLREHGEHSESRDDGVVIVTIAAPAAGAPSPA